MNAYYDGYDEKYPDLVIKILAAVGKEYLAYIDAMLITARIKGGNSGGPVINSNGSLVGIA